MRTLAFDGGMGASGDMLLGALLAVGADPSVLEPVESTLGVQYSVSRVDRAGIEATHVRVIRAEESAEPTDAPEDGRTGQAGTESTERVEDADDSSTDPSIRPFLHLPREAASSEDHTHSNEHDQSQSHTHSHTHSHEHDHSHSHTHDDDGSIEGGGATRTLAEILEIVDELDLPASVAENATDTFRLLAEAESAVHGTDVETVHVHEVGADDAIADIVGTALLVDDLDVERIVTLPLSTGSGSVRSSHGEYPVPAPAVVEIVERADWAVRGGPVEGELLTPTGAALLAHFATGVEDLPPITVEDSGYGAGSRTYADRPNVLRATVGEVAEGAGSTASDVAADLQSESITVLETTLDDATPEILGNLHDSLAEVGALDVAVIPATLKKSRPGHVVQVVAKPDDAPAIARQLGAETGTLGVREQPVSHRWVAERRMESVSIDVDGATYEVGVKVAADRSGEEFDVSAEFDDALAVARETGVPVRTIVRRVESAAVEDR